MEQQQDKRTLHFLRKHIDELFAGGATMVARDPVTLLYEGQTLRVKQGMLVGYSGLLDLIEVVSDAEWRDAQQQLYGQELDEAVRSLEGQSGPDGMGQPVSDS